MHIKDGQCVGKTIQVERETKKIHIKLSSFKIEISYPNHAKLYDFTCKKRKWSWQKSH